MGGVLKFIIGKALQRKEQEKKIKKMKEIKGSRLGVNS